MIDRLTQNLLDSGVVTESHIAHFITEASDLGWPPGHWPDQIKCDFGNKLPLVKVGVSSRLGQVTYRQDCGVIELVVFND